MLLSSQLSRNGDHELSGELNNGAIKGAHLQDGRFGLVETLDDEDQDLQIRPDPHSPCQST